LAKRGGAYKSEKRKKEVLRQKKQEEKRKKRLQKHTDTEGGAEQDTENRES
jgi:heme exporter protein D